MTTSPEQAPAEFRRVLAELGEQSRLLRAVIDSVPAMIGYWDTELHNVLANQAYVEWFGKSPEQIRGKHIRELLGDELYALNRPYMDAALAGVAQAFDRTIVDAEGRTRYSQAAYVPDKDDDGVVRGFFVLVGDVTQRVQAEMRLAEATAELERRAATDPLTSLGNRSLLEQRAGVALAGLRRAAPGTRSVALLLLDLAGFKPVNDRFGHAAGDELLVEVAQRLRGEVREPDVVARLGGDEFVVLIDRLQDPHEAVLLAERIRDVLKEPVVVEDNEVFTTVSIGIAVTTAPDDDADGMLRDADAAMYLAKARGRDRYEIFDEELRSQALERLRTETYLRRALEMGEIEVYYQPELSLDTGMMVGAEALARWHHPVAGLLEAGSFIELAEDSGLILDLGAWVLREACRQAGEWHRSRPDFRLTIRVNLSARQIAQSSLVDLVVDAMAAGGIEPASLCLEITETALMADPAAGLKVLQDLRALGVRLAIDDFGTGYSSLSYLKRFPVDVIKIDRSFVDGLGIDPEDTAIVTAIISLGRALGLRVVAEGVENPRQLAELRRLGCDRGQGFMFSPPRPADLLWDIPTPYPMDGQVR
jgi:diguanylate cyclase (GGDEF)-like protein/PAS domain S-box-containing protein